MGREVSGALEASRITRRAARSAGGRVGWGWAAMGGATAAGGPPGGAPPARPGVGEARSWPCPCPREDGAGESPDGAAVVEGPPAQEGAAEGGRVAAAALLPPPPPPPPGPALGGRGGRSIDPWTDADVT